MDRNRRRKFGQNFLNNPGIIGAIIKDLPFSSGEAILEIGPGHGALTTGFLGKGANVTSVEIDPEVGDWLTENIDSPNFKLELTDFMDFDLEGYIKTNSNGWIVGNLPYNMATPIVTKILPHLHHFKGMMIMVQLEAGQRLIAVPSTKAYSFLTVQLACFAKAKILRKVKPENFTPKPNVMSATLLLEPLSKEEQLNTEMLDMVGTSFRQRRKKLSNNLKNLYEVEDIKKAYEILELSDNVRAEELTPLQFHKLYEILNPS